MATVGALIAELSANTASFQRDMGKAVGILNSSSAKMNGVLAGMERRWNRLNKVAGIAITAIATKLAVDGVKNALNFADAIKNSADASGLGAAAYQEFRFAISQSGGDVAIADRALLKFNNTLGDAAKGSFTAQKALADIGISVDDLRSKSVEELFVKASDNLSKFTSESLRNSAVADVFGEKQTKIAQALALSGGEMAKLREQARQTGAVLSEETIANAKKTKDQFEALANIIKVQMTDALVQIGPLLVKTAGFIRDVGEMAAWAARRLGLTDAITDEQKYQALLERRLDISELIAARGAGGTMFDPDYIEKLKQDLADVDRQLEDMRHKAASAPKARPPAATNVERPQEIWNLLHELERATQQVNLSMITDDRQAAQTRMNIAENELIFKASRLRLLAAEGQTLTTQQKDFMERFQLWVEASQKAVKFQSRSAVEIIIEDWSKGYKQLQDAQGEWLKNFSDTLTDFVTTGKLKFKDFANSIIRDLVRIQIQSALTNALSGTALGALFGLGGAAAGAGGVAPASGGNIAFAAHGGPVSGGNPYIVGERGPELFVPRTSGNIIPNDRLGGARGGTFYIDARGADPAGLARVEQLIAGLDGSIEYRALAAVANEVQRGGRYAAAFAA